MEMEQILNLIFHNFYFIFKVHISTCHLYTYTRKLYLEQIANAKLSIKAKKLRFTFVPFPYQVPIYYRRPCSSIRVRVVGSIPAFTCSYNLEPHHSCLVHAVCQTLKKTHSLTGVYLGGRTVAHATNF